MNPFDLRGPEFLLFYIALSIVVIFGMVVVRRKVESGPTPRIDLSDPLLIAFLRGGYSEAMRVAAVSLIDRGLLLCIGTRLETAPKARSESVRRPIEKALLEKFISSGEADSMFADSRLKSTLDHYDQTLKQVCLLPDRFITQVRSVILGAALFVLAGVGIIKLIIALERGRTNVGFLFILIIVACVIAAKLAFPRLTESGKAILEDVKNLYAELKGRAPFLQPGGATMEPMMLAAVFGVGALAGEGFAYTKTLFPRAQSYSMASGCGSSCGSGCGSSCGGGCGGGCGGCGS